MSEKSKKPEPLWNGLFELKITTFVLIRVIRGLLFT